MVGDQLSGKRLFVDDLYCGANPAIRLQARFVTEVAWQSHFVKNMFIRPAAKELETFEPDFVVLNGAKLAGTKRGITELTPIFSACFGAAFLSLHPTQYAEVLNNRMEQANAHNDSGTHKKRTSVSA